MAQNTAWDFPGNSAGQIRGFADAGIETFNANALRALARETVQNSIDAAAGEGPVRVEFVRHRVPTTDVPGQQDLLNAMTSGSSFWAGKSVRAQTYLISAAQTLRGDTVSILRVSDYGTTGLSEPFNRDLGGAWGYLTKVDGGASKGSGAGGSFGIGKTAPFTASNVRTIFYRTLNSAGERAAQGVARLLSFRDAKGEITSGFGYYGDPTWNGPVQAIEALDAVSPRNAVGTDLFIYGFQGSSAWLPRMEAEILDNFLLALYEGWLEVRLEDQTDPTCEPIELNRATLGARLAADVSGDALLTRGFYEVLSGEGGETKTFTREISDLGTARLRVIMDPRFVSNRRALMVRSRGMKLFNLGRFPGYLNFAAVVDLQGDRLNDFFREMESAAHDSWEPSRHSDPAQARKQWDDLRSWIRSTIRSLGDSTSHGEIEAAGQTDLLRRNCIGQSGADGQAAHSSEDTFFSIAPNPTGASLGAVVHRQPSAASGGDAASDVTVEQRSAGRQSAPASQVRPQPPQGTAASADGTRQRMVADADARQRIIRLPDSSFRVSITTMESVHDGTVELTYVGENAQSVAVDLADVQSESPSVIYDRKLRRIRLQDVRAGDRIQFSVRVRETENYAMRAVVYAYR